MKVGLYGAPGSGKTFTALLIAEGLALATKKRVAYVDTERGTDFYCKDIPSRAIHPKGFDFDAIYTRSLTEVTEAVKKLSADEYSVIVIDSITHLWDAAKAAYSGNTTKIGTIPMQAWGGIKKPYKTLITFLLSTPMHVIICGREATEFGKDEDTDELTALGKKMKAEGETAYEPHILIHMEAVRGKKGEIATITAFAEKDRTGILAGRLIKNPTFENLAAPILPFLGLEQAKMQDEDETAAIDAEAATVAEASKEKESKALLEQFTARLTLAKNSAEIKAIGKEITAELKKKMLTEHVAQLRDVYGTRESEFKA